MPRCSWSIGRPGAIAVLILGTLAGAPTTASAATDAAASGDGAKQRLESVTKAMTDARAGRKAIDAKLRNNAEASGKLKTRLVALAATMQRNEAEVAALTAREADLRQSMADQRATLTAERDQLAATLAAMISLRRGPRSTLFASAGSTTDLVRAALLLRTAVPRLDQRMAGLREQLGALDQLNVQAAAERRSLAQARTDLAASRTALVSGLADRAAREQRLGAARGREQKKLDRLAGDARDLRQLLARLAARERAASRPATTRPTKARLPSIRLKPPAAGSTARLSIPLPAVGRLVVKFGEPQSDGAQARGMTIETAFGAAVIAPNDGKVMFSAPFRDYGPLLIVSMGERYHLLLAGLGRIDVTVGQWLLAGEPLGLMAERETGHELADGPRLYIELRRDGVPINPLPWIAANDKKASG